MTTSELFAMHDPSLTWDEVGEFAEAAGMPLLLKGILRPDDAERAVDAVAGRADVLVDGGIRRGWDVAKALCLGADAVLVGRPVLWGLAQGGQDGAEAVLTQLLAELDTTLALLGCPNARDLDSSFLVRPT
jgi:4-hydroxymandelate oxidase